MTRFYKRRQMRLLLLLATMLLLCNTGFAQVLISENFNSSSVATPPTGWSSVDNISAGAVWRFDNPGARVIGGGNPGFSDNFAILDGANYNLPAEDAELVTPTFDASQPGNYKISFDNQVRMGNGQTCQIDVWDGLQWNNVYYNTGDDGYPNPADHKDIDISAVTGGSFFAKVRFHYTGFPGGWWAIDNVTVSRIFCTPPIATFSVIPDCATNNYWISVDLTSLGDANNIAVSDGTNVISAATMPGNLMTGPFMSATPTTLTLIHDLDNECNIASSTFISICNDECSGATPLFVNPDLGCGSITPGSTIGATASAEAAPSCGTPGTSNDVWFTFVATDATQQVSLSNFSNYSATTDLETSVYSGTCGSFTEIACSDPEQFFVSGLTVGDTYYLRVGTDAPGANATFTVCIGTNPAASTPPANDDCGGAIALTVNPDTACVVTTAASTTGATQSADTAPACGSTGINDDIWYTFTTTAATAYRIRLTNITGSTSDLAAAVYSGACGSLTEVTCSDPQTFDVAGLAPNTTYYLRIWTISADVTDSANFDICIGALPPAAINDDCANAIVLQCNTTVTGTTTSSVNDGLTNFCGTDNINDQTAGGVWYTFTGNGGGVTLSTCNAGTNFNTRLNVFSGACGAFVCEAGNDDDINCTASASTVSLGSTISGQTYYVLVHGNGTQTGDFELSMACACEAPVVNLGNDTFICPDVILPLDAGNPGDTYLFSDGSEGQILDVTLPGLYYVTVFTTQGCYASDSILVNAINPPFVFLGNDTTICQGSVLTLDAGTTSTSYLWSDGSTNQTLDVSTGGLYSVVVTGGAGCTATDAINVTVVQPPVVNLGADAGICPGGSITLDAGVFTGTYAWDDGNTEETRTVTAPGTYSVTVTVAGGCTGSSSINIFELAAPVINLGNDTAICQGTPLTLDAGVIADAMYMWSDGSMGQTLTVAAAGQYYVTATTTGGCSSSDTIQVTEQIVAVNLGNDTAICEGTTLTLDAGAIADAMYMWSDGSMGQTLTVAAAGQYYVIATTTGGCSGSDTIQVTEQIVAVNLGNDTAICEGTLLTLDAGAIANAMYMWNDGSMAQTFDVTSAGQYYVTATTAGGCTSSDTINIGINTAPVIGLIQPLGVGLVYGFIVTAPGADNVAWDYGDGGTGNGQISGHTYAENGTYTVTAIATNACGSDTATATVTATSLGEEQLNASEAQITMYPNPATDKVTIESKQGTGIEQIMIINIVGQVVYSENAGNAAIYELNTAAFATGIYTVRIHTDRGDVVRKLQVQK